MKKKIVITGSQGYIGRHVVQMARRSGHYVVEMDLPGGDVRDLNRVLGSWKGKKSPRWRSPRGSIRWPFS